MIEKTYPALKTIGRQVSHSTIVSNKLFPLTPDLNSVDCNLYFNSDWHLAYRLIGAQLGGLGRVALEVSQLSVKINIPSGGISLRYQVEPASDIGFIHTKPLSIADLLLLDAEGKTRHTMTSAICINPKLNTQKAQETLDKIPGSNSNNFAIASVVLQPCIESLAVENREHNPPKVETTFLEVGPIIDTDACEEALLS